MTNDKKVLIAIVVFLSFLAFCVLVALIIDGIDRNQPSKSEIESSRLQQKARVIAVNDDYGKQYYYQLDASLLWDGHAFTLTNEGNRVWHHVIVEINSTLEMPGYRMIIREVAPGEILSLRGEQFPRGNGTIFDPAITKLEVVSILCQAEGITFWPGYWVGRFD